MKYKVVYTFTKIGDYETEIGANSKDEALDMARDMDLVNEAETEAFCGSEQVNMEVDVEEVEEED